jgi:alpha,alpha-trehalose phosphorylase
VIGADVFAVEPWAVVERELHVELIAQTESLFALSNGHVGLRGNLDEGEPAGAPGTFLNGFYEVRPLPYAEAAYGNPEAGQTMINVTNGKVARLLVDDEPFDVRYGRLISHERRLDLREGVLQREVEWCSPAGQAVRIRTTRMVSFVQRAVAAVCLEVEPVGAPARIVVQSELVANEPGPEAEEDPRAAAALRSPLVSEQHRHDGLWAGLVHRTRESGLRMAAAMDHVVEGPDGTVTDVQSEPDLARVTVSTELEPGETLRVVKFLAYGWSSQRSLPALRDQVDAALAAAKREGWKGLRESQREYLDDVWARADIELDGDPALQQAVRFALFQVVQAGARAERRAIPAKGLTGSGYDGHSFWDMETYTLPVLTYVAPEAARDALLWRHSTLELAAARARELSVAGVTFPWRTINGQECSGYWPAGTAAFHINADIADAVRRYVAATGDEEFEQGAGLELLVATARLWRSLGHHDAAGGFRIDGVTGPDEYTALVDNNVYTNLMAARNLRAAADLANAHPDRAAALDVDQEEIAGWRDAADAMIVPFDEDLGVTAQCEGFTRYRQWDFETIPPDDYPLLMNFHNYLLYSSQVVKQADLVFALYACGDCFAAEQKARDFAYYERITVRDSSLSAAIQAIVAAEVGQLDLAYDYFGETAFIDLRDLAFNTKDGVHLASLAGTWLVAVAGFGGMRDHGDTLAFAPRLPPKLTRLSFRLLYRGRRLRVEVHQDSADYELLAGEPLKILHHGEQLTVHPGATETRALPPSPHPAPVVPPPKRSPPRRHREQ